MSEKKNTHLLRQHLKSPFVQFLLVLALGAIHILLYLVFVPPWQFPDEPRHYEYVRLYAELGRRPTGRDRDPALEQAIVHSMAQFDFWRFGFATVNYVPESPPRFRDLWGAAYAHALFQPPLYYKLAGYLVSPFPRSLIVPQLYVIRLFSWGIGVLNLVLMYLVGYALGKHRLGVLFLLFASLLPGHAFINAAVINDGLAETWGLLALLSGIVLLTRGWHVMPLLVLMGSVVLGLFTKRTTLALIPWAGYVLAYLLTGVLFRMRARREWLVGGSFLSAAAIAGAFVYVWEQGLIGVPRDAWEKLVTGVYWQEAQTLPWGRYVSTLFTSFWGNFGWLNVPLPGPIYTLLLIITVIAAAGWAMQWRGYRSSSLPYHPWLVFGGFLIALLTQWALVFGKEVVYAFFGGQSLPQGRYLYTLLPIYAAFYILGWRPWLRMFRLPEGVLWSLGLLVLAVVALGHLVNVYYALFPSP